MVLEIRTICQTAMKANSGSGDTALHKACRNGRSVSENKTKMAKLETINYRTWQCTSF